MSGALLELPSIAQRRAVISFLLSTVAAEATPAPAEMTPAMRSSVEAMRIRMATTAGSSPE